MSNIRSLIDEVAATMAGTKKNFDKMEKDLNSDIRELKTQTSLSKIKKIAESAGIDITEYHADSLSDNPRYVYYQGDSSDTTISLYLDKFYHDILTREEDSNASYHMGGWVTKEYYIEGRGWLVGDNIADKQLLFRDINKKIDGINEWFSAELDDSFSNSHEISFTARYREEPVQETEIVRFIELTDHENHLIRNTNNNEEVINFISEYIDSGFIKKRTLRTE